MQRPTDDEAIRPNAQRVVETAKDSRMVGKPRQRKVKGASRARGKAPANPIHHRENDGSREDIRDQQDCADTDRHSRRAHDGQPMINMQFPPDDLLP